MKPLIAAFLLSISPALAEPFQLSIQQEAESPTCYVQVHPSLGCAGIRHTDNGTAWRVIEVDPQSSAYGVIRPGDVVTAINGRPTSTISLEESNSWRKPVGLNEVWSFQQICGQINPIINIHMYYFDRRQATYMTQVRLDRQMQNPHYCEVLPERGLFQFP